VNAKNALEALVHGVEKTLKDHGDKASAEEKAKIEAALKEAQEALQSGDTEAINQKAQALSEASHSLAEKMYAAEQGAAGAQPGAAPHGAHEAPGQENVVDAEFEEVKDKKK
jgi:molecular chaperone DnaK